MIRFIWRSWSRDKRRLILLLIGALIMSSGLSYLFSLSQNNKGTIVNILQKKWHASYDILVRPKNAPSFNSQNDLLEPDYLSNIQGGISMNQYHQIEKIPGVKVAAPLAIIGYLEFHFPGKTVSIKKPGIYKVTSKHVDNNGLGNQIVRQANGYYFTVGKKYKNPSLSGKPAKLGYTEDQLLVAIDPSQEAKLVGLAKATATHGNSRYFTKQDQAELQRRKLFHDIYGSIPVLINPNPLKTGKEVYTVQRLNINYSKLPKLKKKLIHMDRDKIRPFLNQFSLGKLKKTFTVQGKDAIPALFKANGPVNPYTGQKIRQSNGLQFQSQQQAIFFKSSGIHYTKATSPFPKRWPYAFQVHQIKKLLEHYYIATSHKYVFRQKSSYVKVILPHGKIHNKSLTFPEVRLNVVGFYDPSQLKISKDPLTKLPMETYRPPQAQLVLNGQGQPVNPPKTMTSTDNPFGLLTQPPTMLTTLDAAQKIIGKKPISSIRIKVAGVKKLNGKSQRKLEHVAKMIEKKTGLKAAITLGSSPQPVIIHVQKHSGSLGWIQQIWIHLGTAITIFHETMLGFSGIIAVVLAVAVLYVLATHLVSLLARRKEFAVLLALGWRVKDLVRMIFIESLLLGSFVVVIAWLIEVIFFKLNGTFSWQSMLLVAVFAFAVYLLGAVWPAFAVSRISPYEAMQTGEVSGFMKRFVKTRSRFSMVFNQLLGRFNRYFLSILAIAMPTTLVAFFLFITFRLKGILYSTWFGKYVALHVGPAHYIAMVIALVIAILITIEIMWQNISERTVELSLLKAIGWRNGSVRYLIWLEGLMIGFLAALAGIGLVLLLIWGMYGAVPVKDLPFIFGTGVIPLIIGFLGSIVPGEIAVRVRPSEGMKRE